MRALVTGGGGFLGKAIVRRLLDAGHQVASLSRSDYPELRQWGVEVLQGDLADPQTVAGACRRCDIVFHVAAKAGIWGPYREYFRTNVTGTANVLAGCRQWQIPRLVYTSSPSVVFTGRDMEGVDESAPYPRHYEAHYPKTKARAERLVLEANSAELATVSLRPHLIWGPGDNQLVPRIIARARAGQLRRIGREDKRVDTVFIDNAADAHMLAANRLAPRSAIAGKAYFIAQDAPVPLWDLVNRIIQLAHLPPVTRVVSPQFAYLAGCLLELTYGILGWSEEPRMTRFLARELATAHWFNLKAARQELGYQPKITTAEGLERLGVWLEGFYLPRCQK